MASRILYFGDDTSHRIAVLQAAGYHVEKCGSLMELADSFGADPELTAVLFGEDAVCRDLLLLAASRFPAPLVVFRQSYRNLDEAAFDHVVPLLQRPEEWLADLRHLIDRRGAVSAQARVLSSEARDLCRGLAQAAACLANERQGARGFGGKRAAVLAFSRRPWN